MAGLQQIVELLIKTTQDKTQVIKSAQMELEQISKTHKNFVNLLLSITTIQGISPIAIRVATVYTLTYVRNLVTWQVQADINYAAQQLLNYVCDQSIQYKSRDQVGAALQYLITKDHNNIIAIAYMSNMIDTFQTQKIKPPKQIPYQSISLVCQILSDKANPGTGGCVETYLRQQFIALPIFISNLLDMANQYISVNDNLLEKLLIIIVKFTKILKKGLKKFIYFNPQLVQTLYAPQYQQSITKIIKFDLPQNKIKVPLFYQNPSIKYTKILECFHNIKGITVYNLTQTLRIIINTSLKQSNTITKTPQSKLFKLCPEFITIFSEAMNSLLSYTPYQKLNSKLKFKIIEEIFNFMILALRSSKFYTTFYNLRGAIVFGCIFKTLAFTSKDYDSYYHDPEEFANSLFHIIEINVGYLLGNDKPEMEDSEVQIEIFDTLKTNSANLLKTFVKYIDGTIIQLLYCIINTIQERFNLQYSKMLMYFLLCILRDEIKMRSQQIQIIKRLVFRNLQQLELPTKSVQQPYSNTNNEYIDIQYTMNLLVLTRYVLLFDEVIDDFNTIQRTQAIIQKLIKNPKVEEVPKIFACDAILVILETRQGLIYSKRILQLLNDLLTAKKLNIKFLDCIHYIIKSYDEVFKEDYVIIIEIVEKISSYIQSELKKNEKDKQKDIINMLWNILDQIIVSKALGTQMIDTMKRVIQPLMNMINGNNELELEQKVFMLMDKMISRSITITQFQLQVFSILPKIFYVGPNKFKLSTSFSLLQSIIFHGRQILSSDIILSKNLILICLQNITKTKVNQKPRSQTDCLQGLFTLQSLIICIGNIFNSQIRQTVIKALTKKLQDNNLVYEFVKQSLVSTLCLMLSSAFSNFTTQDNQYLLKLIFKQYHNLTHKQQIKLFVISASNLLQGYKQPFISNNFTQLLDCTITLMKYTLPVMLKQKISYEQLDEEKYYESLAAKVKNCYSDLDQFSYFKSVIESIKESDYTILQRAYNQLPETKRNYLKELLNIRKVKENPRVIYKLKNKGGHSNDSQM